MREKPPSVLRAPGKELWHAVVDRLDCTEVELALVQEAAECRDMIAELRKAVRRDGVLIPSTGGDRAHPGIEASRKYSERMSAIIGELKIPEDALAELPDTVKPLPLPSRKDA